MPEGLQRGVPPSVPRGAEDGPLRLPVGAVQYPEEAARGIAPAEGEGVHLHVPRRDVAGPDALPGGAWRAVLHFVAPAPPGAPVPL